MRNLVFALGATLLVSSCARPEKPDWMIGTWQFQRPLAVNGPQPCAGGSDPRAYSRNGFYVEVNAAEYGRWEVKGKRLIHHVLRVRGREIPVKDRTDYIFRIDSRSTDRLDVNRGPDEQMTMIRCTSNPDGSFAADMPH